MAGIGRADAGPPPGQLDIEGTLFRAALLSGYGRDASPLARRLAAAARTAPGRSCLEAGAPLQLTIDAPGPAALRVGIRLGEAWEDARLVDLVPAGARVRLGEIMARLPPAQHASLGTWLFWTEARQSIFIDLRDPRPGAALARLHHVLDDDQRMRLDRLGDLARAARPWALRVEAGDSGLRRLHVHWLIDREKTPQWVADTIAPGLWPRAVSTLGVLLRRPGFIGRWLVATPIDGVSEPALRIGNSGWTFVPEHDDRKHRAVAELMRTLGGPCGHAEALWSFCRGAALPEWRVGRACELKITGDGVRARLFFTPQVTA